MNMAAVFVSLLFWAWLWGMLLGIPIIVIVKVVSQHVEQLHPVAELLGEWLVCSPGAKVNPLRRGFCPNAGARFKCGIPR